MGGSTQTHGDCRALKQDRYEFQNSGRFIGNIDSPVYVTIQRLYYQAHLLYTCTVFTGGEVSQ